MSEPAKHEDHDDLDAPTPNGQLTTPALSPISEHGDQGLQPFPSYELEQSGDGQVERETNGRERHQLSIQTNGTAHIDRRKSSTTSPKTAKLSPTQLQEFVQSPDNLPIRALEDSVEDIPTLPDSIHRYSGGLGVNSLTPSIDSASDVSDHYAGGSSSQTLPQVGVITTTPGAVTSARPTKTTRSISTPLIHRKHSSSRTSKSKVLPPPLKLDDESATLNGSLKVSSSKDVQSSPMPSLLPVPPLSFPTYLQLELSSARPSALYIHRSAASEFPYESAKVKFERMLNFLLLPFHLEQVLWFGAIACLDAWLYTFTILPLRFVKAVAILGQWAGQNAAREMHDLGTFVYSGLGRVWQRRRQSSVANARRPSFAADPTSSRRPSAIDGVPQITPRLNGHITSGAVEGKRKAARHRRTRSTPSLLLPNHKADILQGLLIAASCFILTWFDASRMYHSIRGQAAIRLYVIYNVLEVFDRLFSALGQDVLECLFSKETLERNEHGRSKIIRPLWMFMLALVYNVVHATALFYQVVTLNVAVNSYSNALLTLLMSNQFVEIKGTVFKKFEKENLFQLTCADVVERFQLWLMLLIIALRNIVEVGGLTISLNTAFASPSPSDTLAANSTGIPLTSGYIIPKAFTILPKWTGEVLGPFLIVLGSEALVDWCKHAYINKFNNVKPNIYGRFLDVLAKDYYTHAFADQNLTKRLGLPVIPLSCLFIRACMQTYHMFLATHMPLPIPSSVTGVSLESEATASNPATTAALQHIDHVFRRALGRSSFGAGREGSSSSSKFSWWSLDDAIALATMAIFFLALYLVLLALKLVLGMALLSFSRNRYRGMKDRERQVVDTQGKRVGGWGVVEVGEEKRRWIYEDDPDGLRDLREREDRGRKRTEKGEMKLDGVQRYSMVAKRIW